ncbi:MAG: aminotransferase class V-fold PLP-dependent enzyme [Defluviitaleaceae bacterium]|nr:aminotransferase class V-fold PLP-dependent enzyme [Defluviitaleaceae bacterium]
MNGQIYFDNASTTRLCAEALDAMMPHLTECYGNPSSKKYSLGADARSALEKARETVAAALNAEPDEIYFTSGGTESNNWAISGAAQKTPGGAVVVAATEHHAVLKAAAAQKKFGHETVIVPVDGLGFTDTDALRAALEKKAAVVSVMLANNETGTVTRFGPIEQAAHERGVLLHTDAVQAAGHIPIDVKKLNADMLSISAHKFYGPKGVGALYIKRGTDIGPFVFGGSQERGGRAGTENVAGIAGMAEALRTAAAKIPEETERLCALRDRIIGYIKQNIPHAYINGAEGAFRLPGNVNFSMLYVEGDYMLDLFTQSGFCVSSGSACTSGLPGSSHVIDALYAHSPHRGTVKGTARITLGRYNTEREADALLSALPEIVKKLRDNLLYEEFIKSQGK